MKPKDTVEILRAFVTLVELPEKRSDEAQRALDVLVQVAREGGLPMAIREISRN
jgi:hypothetical protein